jgi:hypothetical protein
MALHSGGSGTSGADGGHGGNVFTRVHDDELDLLLAVDCKVHGGTGGVPGMGGPGGRGGKKWGFVYVAVKTGEQ